MLNLESVKLHTVIGKLWNTKMSVEVKWYHIDLTTPTKLAFILSGTERDFVVISTVRSLPENEVLSGPSPQWLALHLGFLTDEHQINVAITRARHGLFIVGKY